MFFEGEGEVIDLGIGFHLRLATGFGVLGVALGLFVGLLLLGFLFRFVGHGGVGDGIRGVVFVRLRLGGHVRVGDDVGELAQRLGGEGVLDGFPVGLDLLFGGIERVLEGIDVEAGEFAIDLLVVEGEFTGDGVTVHGEAGTDDGVDFL